MDEAITCSACRELLSGNGSFVDHFSKEIKQEDKIDLKSGLDVNLHSVVNCRACALQKTAKDIQKRWSNKLLPGFNWDVDEDKDYIHTHDYVHLDETDSSWIKLYASQSDFRSAAKELFVKSIQNDVKEVDFNLCSIENIDAFMWTTMSNIKTLNLNSCSFDTLPEQIRSLKFLEALILNNNDLLSLPSWIGELQDLKILNVYDNKLSSLPEELCDLSNLEEFIFSCNSIIELPKRFGSLINLRSLEGDYNRLISLPESFGSLKNIVKISLHSNSIDQLPQSFANLEMLSLFDLSQNRLTELPEFVKFASNISTIILDDNCLVKLPDWFSCAPNLIRFSCKKNNLEGEVLRKDFLEFSNKLEELNFDGNKIDNLPETISHINTLTHLEMGSIEKVKGKHNSKSCPIPPSFGVFSSDLTELKIIGNHIFALPDGFGNGLQKLVKIDLSHNGLTKILPSFCSMKNLRECILSYNKLKRLPENFSDLVNLEHLKLDNNEVNQLPLSFSQCHNLSTLDLCGNPFSTFPSLLIKMPQLQCLGIDIDLSHTPLVMKDHFSPQDILHLHSAHIHGIDCYNRKSTPMEQRDLNSNQAFIAKITEDTLILKRKSLDSRYFKNRSVKHSRTHFDFFEPETMIFDDELDWAKSNNLCCPVGSNCISVKDSELIRLMVQKELTFSIREHMPRMPNKSVSVPLFSKNPLFPPRKRKRVILRQKR